MRLSTMEDTMIRLSIITSVAALTLACGCGGSDDGSRTPSSNTQNVSANGPATDTAGPSAATQPAEAAANPVGSDPSDSPVNPVVLTAGPVDAGVAIVDSGSDAGSDSGTEWPCTRIKDSDEACIYGTTPVTAFAWTCDEHWINSSPLVDPPGAPLTLATRCVRLNPALFVVCCVPVPLYPR